ncbi:reverse transcriptase [Ancylostoma duodenale]|uniref:Reverse transcriptase n=1 Tax=Ancylostoma duodenale TaxID=51022 RepID=A0A0C2FB75_9BILA|nr:reverse transcriptase [Ancylostoma duodenale]
MKKGTPGPDNIPADLLRAGNTALYSVLAKHFNHYLENGMIPDQWNKSKTILLFKKGQREDIANYRPISLLSVVYKTFTKILLNRMERILDDYQPVEQNRFVDYKKAFDSVETNAVLNALTHAGIPSMYIHLLEQCFSNKSTAIQLFDRKLEIPIERGVRQGDTISPKLFTAALQHAMSELDWEDKGYLIDGKKISNLRFADDIVLVANKTAEMETMINELNVAGLKIGLEVNMSKTQLMVNQ